MRLAAVAVGAVAVLGALALGGSWLAERDVLPARTAVAGVEVGGRTPTAARLLVAEAAAKRVRQPVRLRVDGESVEVTGVQLGATALVDDAIERADGVGLFSRIARRFGIGETRVVELRYAIPAEQIRRLADELDRRVAVDPRDARLVVRGTETTVEAARVGRSVAVGRLAARLRTLPATIDVPVGSVRPEVTTASAEKAKRTADTLLAGPRRVVVGAVSATLPPTLLARAIEVAPTGSRLGLSLDPDVLRTPLERAFRELEREPKDAGFSIDGTRVTVTPARPGRTLDVERIARSLLANLRAVAHKGRFVTVPPARTTEQAEALDITELVSEFTTNYPCCAPRVTNIQRAAALLDGTVLEAGETFSLNDALGRRTEQNGFVSAPQIRAGRLEDAVGGGISQVATTLYNAAFFAGLRLDEHQPHEFYISRYPMGREATVSWRDPELIFTNDWPAGLLMKLYASDTGITVRFYSTMLGRRVETETGDPYDTVAPRTITTKNPSLPPGTREVLQDSGASGFTVQYTRKVWRGSTLKRDERWTVRYRPQNGYVEVGPPKKKPQKQGKAGKKTTPDAGQPGQDGAPGETTAPESGAETTPPPR